MKVFPQIRQLFERLPIRRPQHGVGRRIGENDAPLRLGYKHAFSEVIQYSPEVLPSGLGLGAGHLLSIQ